jgi:hypothetical protein
MRVGEVPEKKKMGGVREKRMMKMPEKGYMEDSK